MSLLQNRNACGYSVLCTSEKADAEHITHWPLNGIVRCAVSEQALSDTSI